MSVKSFGERIADVLIEDGLLLPSQLAEAVELQKAQGGRLLKLLTDKQYVTEQDMVISMGRCLDVPPINLSKVRVPEEVAELVPKEMARQYKLAPVCKLGNKLFVAMADPLNVLALDDLRQRTKFEIVPMITTERSVMEALSGVGSSSAQMDQVLKDAAQDAANVEEVKVNREEIDLDRLAVESEDAPVVKIVNLILVQALKEKASDIHLEPFEKQFKLRYRVDGNLIEASSPPKGLQLAIASRIKILAGLDIAERRLPQDGRIKLKMGKGKEMDFRVSICPVLWGEKTVMRLLDKSNLQLDMTKLGFEEAILRGFKDAINKPYGMILITGPTGSGKTTTLYSTLSELNKSTHNISTAEDPIEYNLYGINQVQMHDEIGLNFAAALRCFLRQDPDIIMVGEIRDFETAEIAVKAALTGHLVLSTLHTNDAPSTVSRLLNMGIEPFLVASSVNLIGAQRLVRKLCVDCKAPVEITRQQLIDVGIPPEDVDDVKPMRGQGCKTCNNTGYKGRIAVYEIMIANDEVKEFILNGASTLELKREAVRQGMKTLRMSAISKFREGQTSLEEIVRTTAPD